MVYPNPLDPNIPPDVPKLYDAVLFNRRYYLYQGAGPAAMLFLPYRLATGYDLPEAFALFLFGLGGYVFAGLTLMSLFAYARVEVKPGILALLLLALGFCQSVPFLLNRPWFYEIAIGGGYFCVSAGLFFLVRGLQSPRKLWMVAAGLMFGMAIACRPHLGIAGALALLAAVLTVRRRALPMAVALTAMGLAIGGYNYLRFGNPADFGVGYRITGPFQAAIHVGAANVLPGLYYLLVTPPELSKIFPWVQMRWPPPSIPRPPLYFLEPLIGALFLAPFLPAALAFVLVRSFGVMRWVLVGAGFCILAFVVTTGLSTQRYEVDFLPLMTLAAMAAFGYGIARCRGAARASLVSVLTLAVISGTVVNLALAITGSYDDLMKNKPARYIAIARRLSPVARLRPQLDPPIAADFTASVGPAPEHYTQDFLFAGRRPWRYELFLDHLHGGPVLVSRIGLEEVAIPMQPSAEPVRFHVVFSPSTHEMTVTANGAEVVRQKIEPLIAAPAQIEVRAANR
jgi:hypothetical protein